ncbi:YlxR family protein [Leifsonia sp. AG29]|uniref:YlxR family protein n=1 Tax=Leifsonia sp. AG29 TaxID=2598860 RepID=UPI00131A6496|nr:YlxR family protein [Leifsonia sp. AG29]
MVAVRTCVGCRSRAPRSSLLRVVARDSEIVADPSAALPGRGAWLHPTDECLDKALNRRAFGRALRVEGTLGTATVRSHIHRQAEEAVTSHE